MSELLVDEQTGEILNETPTEPEPTPEPETEPEPVEPDDDDDDDEPGDEQVRQAANQARAQTEAEVERLNRKLADEAKRHANRIVQIMGDDSEILEQCPLCLPLIPGFRYPQPPSGDQLVAVKVAIGENPTPDLEPDTYSSLCSKCQGYGSVDTGSKVLGQAKVQCVDCRGRGWIPRGPEREGGQVTALNLAPSAIDYSQPSPEAPEPPEVAALKAQGYIVVPPIPPAQVA